MQRYGGADLDDFDVRRVLEHFGLAVVTHGRCPFCDASTGFGYIPSRPVTWACFSCGERGNAVGLYARLSGIAPSRAAAEIASHLGLAESDPGEWDKRKAEREARAEIERAERQAESWRLTRLAVAGHRAERESEWLKGLAFRLKDRNALGLAYEADGRAMVLDYQRGDI